MVPEAGVRPGQQVGYDLFVNGALLQGQPRDLVPEVVLGRDARKRRREIGLQDTGVHGRHVRLGRAAKHHVAWGLSFSAITLARITLDDCRIHRTWIPVSFVNCSNRGRRREPPRWCRRSPPVLPARPQHPACHAGVPAQRSGRTSAFLFGGPLRKQNLTCLVAFQEMATRCARQQPGRSDRTPAAGEVSSHVVTASQSIGLALGQAVRRSTNHAASVAAWHRRRD
jgi:hypothetical protein